MLGRLGHADRVVGKDRVDVERDIAVEQNRGHPQFLEAPQRARVLLAVDGHDEAVDAAMLKHVDGVGFLAGLAIRIHEIQRIAPLAHLRVGRLEGGGVERVGDIVYRRRRIQRSEYCGAACSGRGNRAESPAPGWRRAPFRASPDAPSPAHSHCVKRFRRRPRRRAPHPESSPVFPCPSSIASPQ